MTLDELADAVRRRQALLRELAQAEEAVVTVRAEADADAVERDRLFPPGPRPVPLPDPAKEPQ